MRVLVALLTGWSSWAFGAETIDLPLASSKAWARVCAVPSKAGRAVHDKRGLQLQIVEDGLSLIHVLRSNCMVATVRVNGTLRSSLRADVPPDKYGRPTDFHLRIGIIEKGQRRLTWLEKLLAPEWIVKMEQLVPPSIGLGAIEFFSLGSNPRFNGRQWKARYGIREQQVGALRAGESFDLVIDLPRARNVLAVWLFADGDDSRSSFELQLNRLELVP